MKDVSSNGSFKKVQTILNDGLKGEIPYIRSGNVGDFFIDKNDLTKISKRAHEQLPLSRTLLHDVIMARKGKIGGASVIFEDLVNCNCNENVIKLTLKESFKNKIDPLYLATYLNCEYGKAQVIRNSTGNVQPWTSIYNIRKIKIKTLSKSFQSNINKLVNKAYNKIKESECKYSNCEKFLLQRLGLTHYEKNKDNIAIKSLSESFIENQRLDAEYYQPKYDEIIDIIKDNKYKRLGEIVEIKKSIEPGSAAYQDEGIPFIRVSNLTKHEISQSEVFLDRKEFEKEELKPKKDTILLTKDGSCGIAYKVNKDMDVITSGAILHLKITNAEILPDYLTLVLNSITTKMQAERDAGGSVIQHWKPSEIEEVLIPILPLDLQKKIDKDIRDSYKLRKQSKKILEKAKKAVEIAIKEEEEQGIKYLNE